MPGIKIPYIFEEECRIVYLFIDTDIYICLIIFSWFEIWGTLRLFSHHWSEGTLACGKYSTDRERMTNTPFEKESGY